MPYSGSITYAAGEERRMSARENKALVRRWFEEGFFGDLSLADETFAEETTWVWND